jgi:hypothetical protein
MFSFQKDDKKNHKLLPAKTFEGTEQAAYNLGWREFVWLYAPIGVKKSFWLCPEHADNPPKNCRHKNGV